MLQASLFTTIYNNSVSILYIIPSDPINDAFFPSFGLRLAS